MTALNGFPSTTTAGQGLFGTTTNGLIQGQAFQDPAARFSLRSGIVSTNETVPMWGGLPVYADVSPIGPTGPNSALGQVLGRAGTLATLVGFSVFDQAYNMVSSPTNTVPSAGSGQSIGYYPNGSRARIAVPCAPSLVNIDGLPINTPVGWDFIDEILVPYEATQSAVAITGATWATTSGGIITFTVGTNLTGVLTAGDVIDVSGVISAGGTAGNTFNGEWIVLSVTSTTVVVIASAAAGYYGTYTSGGTIAAAGGALPVTVLEVLPTGCMTVVNTNGVLTYNYNGACALIQLTGGTIA
jgi:hypothetical protein